MYKFGMISKDSGPPGSWVISGVLLTGILLRFLYLSADPYYYEWIGYITDEGRWVQHARSFALHNTIPDHNLDIHFFLAPLFQFTNYLVFELAGVGFLTSRIFTALCGSALLVFFWGFLRRKVTPEALLLSLTLLGLQTDLVMLSRIAVPEMAAIFFELLIYLVIVSSGKSSWRMLLAGFFLLMAAGMKATIVLFLPIFSIIILFMPRQRVSAENRLEKWREVMLFWTGFSLPVIIAVIGSVGYLFSSQQIVAYWNSLRGIFNLLEQFVGVSNFHIYSLISFPFEHTLAPTFNIWALGLWLSALAWMASGKNHSELESHRYLVTSAIWFISYLSLMLSLEYFPTRYKVHILIPMALFIAVGISLLQRIGIRKVMESFAEAEGLSGRLWAGVVSIPMAAFLSPLLAAALILTGMDPERMRIKLACYVSLLIATAYLAHRSRHNQRAVGFFLLFPLVEGLAWMIFSTLANVPFWPIVGYPAHFAWLSLFIGAGLAICAVSQSFVNLLKVSNGGSWVTAFALYYLTISLIRIAPGYIEPHYSIRDASRDIGRLLSGSSAIATIKGEALFNENKLRYKSIGNRVGSSETPNFLILAFRPEQNKDIVEREYYLLKSYQLYIAPEYLRAHGNRDPGFVNDRVTVSVYKKNEMYGSNHRIRAVGFFSATGEIDLYGNGWNDPS